jgi:nucleoid-associated protein YgaU
LKILLAAAILLAGLAAGSFFRRAPTPSGSPGTLGPDRRLYQPGTDAAGSEVQPLKTPAVRIGPSMSAPSRFRASVDEAVIGRSEPRADRPPTLPRTYPQGSGPPDSRWGASLGMSAPGAERLEQSVRVHKIADGDTLASLATRYLGDAARADEIYRANRDVLSRPDLLPIGVTLKIPPRCVP